MPFKIMELRGLPVAMSLSTQNKVECELMGDSSTHLTSVKFHMSIHGDNLIWVSQGPSNNNCNWTSS